jgi:hypothetical protein
MQSDAHEHPSAADYERGHKGAQYMADHFQVTAQKIDIKGVLQSEHAT